MKYYNVIDSHETFDKVVQNPELCYPNMNVIYNGEEIDYDNRKEISYFTAIYDVEDLAVPTKILSNLFDISQVYKMFVDGIEVSPTANYQFGSTGKHTIKCHFLHLTSCENMFCACKDLYEIDLNRLDTSEVTTMKRMFRGVTEDNTTLVDMKVHKIDCESIDTSNVTDMSYMFQLCCKVKHFRLGNFNTSKVTTMNRMFQGMSTNIMLAETTDVSGWDMSNVTDIISMFAYNIKLKKLDVSNWDTSNIKYAGYAFQGYYPGYEMSLEELDTSKWNLSKLEDASIMFQCCTKLKNLDTTNWNCTNLTDTKYMFAMCKNIKQLNVTNWKIPNSCSSMFGSCYALEEIIGIENADVSNVITADYMFNYLLSLKSLIIPNWNITNLKETASMFQGLPSIETIDIRNWDMSKFVYISHMFNIYASSGSAETEATKNTSVLKNLYMNNVVPPTNIDESYEYPWAQIFDIPETCNLYLPAAYKTQWQNIITKMRAVTSPSPTKYLQDSQIIWV